MNPIRALFDWLQSVDVPENMLERQSTKTPKYIFQWPYREPPDGSNPYWSRGVFSNGFCQYKTVEIAPGSYQWTINEDAMAHKRQEYERRHELMWALRSRVLSDEEMAEVSTWGEHLNIDEGIPFSREEKMRELNSLLLQQFQLRAAARAEKP